jgi:hypothetical protein
MRERNYLFQDGRLSSVLEAQCEKLRTKILGFQANYLFKVDEEELLRALIDEFSIEAPQLHTDLKNIDAVESERDSVDAFGRQCTPKVNVYTVSIPFSGEAQLFRFQPDHYNFNPPCAIVHDNEVRVEFAQRQPNARQLKNLIEQEISNIQQYLTWVGTMVESHNTQLGHIARECINHRKQKLQKDIGVLAEIGIPIRKRASLPSTIAVPVRRKPIPLPTAKPDSKPRTPTQPYLQKHTI